MSILCNQNGPKTVFKKWDRAVWFEREKREGRERGNMKRMCREVGEIWKESGEGNYDQNISYKKLNKI